MDSPDRYAEVWKARYAEFLAKGVPDERARAMASEAAAAQILGEVRAQYGGDPPPPLPAAPGRKLRMAQGDGKGLVAMGLLSIVVGLVMRDYLGAVIGALLTGCGAAELVGYRRYLSAHPGARSCLVGSQLAVLGLVWAYCGWSMFGAKAAESPETLQLMREMGADAAEIGPLLDSATRLIYVALAGISLLYQGGLAIYYYKKTAA